MNLSVGNLYVLLWYSLILGLPSFVELTGMYVVECPGERRRTEWERLVARPLEHHGTWGRPFPGPEAVHLDGQRTRLTRVSFAHAHVHTLNALTLYPL